MYRVDDYQFFFVIMVIESPASGVANPKLRGGKRLTSGKQQHFFWDAASQSTKWLDMLKFRAHGPLDTPMGPALLVFHEKFAHSPIFYAILQIYVYFTKSGISNTTRA